MNENTQKNAGFETVSAGSKIECLTDRINMITAIANDVRAISGANADRILGPEGIHDNLKEAPDGVASDRGSVDRMDAMLDRLERTVRECIDQAARLSGL